MDLSSFEQLQVIVAGRMVRIHLASQRGLDHHQEHDGHARDHKRYRQDGPAPLDLLIGAGARTHLEFRRPQSRSLGAPNVERHL